MAQKREKTLYVQVRPRVRSSRPSSVRILHGGSGRAVLSTSSYIWLDTFMYLSRPHLFSPPLAPVLHKSLITLSNVVHEFKWNQASRQMERAKK